MPPKPDDFDLILRRLEAERAQREHQQGRGKQFITAVVGDTRFVAVRNRVMWGKWRTVPDFLMTYISSALGNKWGNAELAKPPDERHPLLNHYQMLCASQSQASGVQRNGIYQSLITGAIASYLGLAYNLYCLDHNAEVQERLLHRLRNPDLFEDTRYEILIAGAFVRAGFSLKHEDEDDRTRTHHEFVATSSDTGRSFSVECKRRNAKDPKNLKRLGRLVRHALKKHADHERIVFVDLNYPELITSAGSVPPWMQEAVIQVHNIEDRKQDIEELPPACIILTNDPNDLFPNETNLGFAAIRTGFKNNEIRHGRLTDLRALINEREKNKEVHDLLSSLREHARIPTTFDGSNPHLAFGETHPRLLVGERYQLDDGKIGLLLDAEVMPESSSAFCTMQMEDGSQAIAMMTLTDDEISGWRAHPTTFFGVVKPPSRPLEGPLDYYDFFLGASESMTKEQLLAQMQMWPEQDGLATKPRDELASILAEARATQMIARSLAPTSSD